MAEQNERQPPVVRDPRVPKFPVIYAAPTFEQVKSNISTNDLVQWAVLGSACFPLGYMVGTCHLQKWTCSSAATSCCIHLAIRATLCIVLGLHLVWHICDPCGSTTLTDMLTGMLVELETGKQLDRNLARPAMLFTGVMGCIGGALLSYQNSELRLQGFGRNHEEVARYLTPKEGESDQ